MGSARYPAGCSRVFGAGGGKDATRGAARRHSAPHRPFLPFLSEFVCGKRERNVLSLLIPAGDVQLALLGRGGGGKSNSPRRLPGTAS